MKRDTIGIVINTLEHLDKKICEVVDIKFEDYKRMTLSDQFKVREKYRSIKHI